MNISTLTGYRVNLNQKNNSENNANFKFSNLAPLGCDIVSFGAVPEEKSEKPDSLKVTDLSDSKRNGEKYPYSYFNDFINNYYGNVHYGESRAEAKLKAQGVDYKTLSTKQLFEAFDIGCEVDPKSGLLILDEYRQPYDCTFSQLGVDENELFKNIKEIKGNANFRNSEVTNLGNLQTIGGDADFYRSQVADLGKLQTIGGDADFYRSQVADLGKLQTIGGNANFYNSQVADLGNLQKIEGDAYFKGSKVTNLGNLQTIEGDAVFSYSQVADLGNLQTIGGSAYFSNSQVTNLGNLQTIGGDAIFSYSQVKDLGNLQTIGGYAYFDDSQVANLGKLKKIGGCVYIDDSPLKKRQFSLVEVGGSIIKY